MRVLKRYACLLLLVFSIAAFLPISSYAADAEIQFSDPTGKVGENVEVSFVIKAGGAVGEASGTISYDSTALEFVSGDSFTEQSAGVLAFSGSGNGTDLEIRKPITFRALKQTSTTITVGSMTAKLASGEALNLINGSSTVTIEPGQGGITQAEPTKTAQTTVAPAADDMDVTVEGKQYSFSDHFAVEDLPEGFSEGTVDYSGTKKRVGVNQANVYLAYLIEKTEGGVGSFFIYDAQTQTFIPFVELKISEGTSIVPLNEPDQVKLPASYQETELTIGERTYPVWNDPSEGGNYYVLYALNMRTGQKNLYRYDSDDGTYQLFEAPETEQDEQADKAKDAGLLAKLHEHFKAVLVAGAGALILLFILMLVFGIKLIRRNRELDELYDEYDFSDEDEDHTGVVPVVSAAAQGGALDADDFDDDPYDEDVAGGYEDAPFDDDDAYDDDDGYDDDAAYDDDGYDDAYEESPYDDAAYDDDGYEEADSLDAYDDDDEDTAYDRNNEFFDEGFDDEDDLDDLDDDFNVMDLFDDEPSDKRRK